MYALTNARLVDGTGSAVRTDVTVVVEGGRIAAVDTDPPAEATIVDLEGKTLLPGLVDAHVHLSS
ncbi:MAG: amidohydrolase family protein, partial [Actinobacteria bacterium]